eukprot:CAMPEP_0172305762 /NCGR_PEP_ID=MMETSP1058-20130122/6999_1 /TAXON_ID=83371 /ORGANISM="Detonula confervacea, Strain CCMP 353" /LENGTH=111 /DNA_ID=CAMNT_0013017467 /DNA_START=29 /DNA_END=364 /DNA_ORIENTATION=-
MTPFGKASGAVAAAARGVERCASNSLPKAFSAPFSSGSNNDDVVDDNDDNHFGVWQPNQTTVIFQRMEDKCPDIMKAYASCVVDKQNSGALVQGACEEKFRAVMDCFRSVR